MKRTMKILVRGVALSLVLAAVSGCTGSVTSAPSTSGAASSTEQSESPAVSTPPAQAPSAHASNEDPGTPTLVASRSGLAKLSALARLPGDRVTVDAAGYPGAKFHRGVFVDPDSFLTFAKAADLKDVPKVDWVREVVAYVVLDAQTNELRIAGLKQQEGGAATLSVQWIGIEPFYADRTPFALAVIHVGRTEQLKFEVVRDGGGTVDLGSQPVSSE
jgi:hypothetical protein